MSTVAVPAEQRVVLRDVSWETYERLLEDHGDKRSPRFTYDRGVLEIMSPNSAHEGLADLVRHLVGAIAEARGIDMTGLGSTTFKEESWGRGFEPDGCFYFRDAAAIRGKDRIDPRQDSPPEIVVKVDITSSSIDKLPVFAQFGVTEVWRLDDERATILVLGQGGYQEVATSAVIPGLDPPTLARLLAEGRRTPFTTWLPAVRSWAARGA